MCNVHISVLILYQIILAHVINVLTLFREFLHWVNNSIAYVVYNLYPDPDMQLIDLFGTQRHVAAAVVFSLFILLPALYQLHLRMKKADA